MNTREIEALLVKFYEGKTSLQEEKDLTAFFRGNHVPPHLISHQPLFAYYRDEQRHELNQDGFEQKLTAVLTAQPASPAIIVKHSNRLRLSYITGIAAGILLFIGLFFTFQHEVFKRKLTQTTLPETEIAYADVSNALMLVSGNLNNGIKHAERLQIVDKAMKNMERFNKFYQVQSIIINPDEMYQSIKSK
jgi:hypothetical protein